MNRRRAHATRAQLLVAAASALCLCVAWFATAHPLFAAVQLPAAEVQSLFFISKSENKNQVHYAVLVDDACRPVGDHPVYGYWRELEVGPQATSKLLDHEQRAYGVGEPRYVRSTDKGGEIRISLRGFPERPLFIETFRQVDGRRSRCAARTHIMIQHQPAILSSIYIDLGFLFSVNYALVRGVRIADGVAVEEKIHD
ncbi:MAG: hypothetical protein RL701_6952 [Pseudomonadota bacterium]